MLRKHYLLPVYHELYFLRLSVGLEWVPLRAVGSPCSDPVT